MKLPKYTDDEVKVFHPVFEFSFKSIFLDNKFFFENYELVHHRKINNGTIPDYIFQNKKNKKSVLICEIKRTRSAVFNYAFNEQVKGYAETLKNEMEKPFYILTNLEIINLYRYSDKRDTVIHQLIKPSPIKVAEFSKESFNNFTKKLETELKSIINLVFDKNITEWKFGLSELEKKLQKNYNNKNLWDEIISEALSGYIVGSILGKKISRNQNTIEKILISNGFEAINKKINYKKDFKIFDNGIEAGKSFKDGSDLGFIIQSIVHQNYEKAQQGIITSTDDELSNLVAFFSKNILEKQLNKEDLIFDPSAGIGNLFINLNNFHKNISNNQFWANEIDEHFIDCLTLRLNFINLESNGNSAKISNKNIADLKKNDFNKVKIIICNPPFKRGANKENSEEKEMIAKKIFNETREISKLSIGQLGVECLHLEHCVSFSNKSTNFIFVFPARYLASLSKETIKFREYLINNFGLEYVVNYPHKNIFSDVAKNTLLLIGNKNTKKNKVKFIEINNDLENLDYIRLEKDLKNNFSNENYSISEIEKKELIKNNYLGWKKYFNNKSFYKLITKSKCKFHKIDFSCSFLPRGNAGNTGGSDLIFPNKNNKLGKEILSLPSEKFMLGIKNSEMIPTMINKESFDYLAINPRNNFTAKDQKNLKNIFVNFKNLFNKSTKNVQYKKSKTFNEISKILRSSRVYEKGTILIPRATRRHGKISIIEEEAVISTNFILLKSKNLNDNKLIASWFLSLYGQLQLEELSNNERGVRKTEINYIKEKFIIPDFNFVNQNFKDDITRLFKNDSIKPIDMNNISVSELDILWSKMLFGDSYHSNLSNFFNLLKLYFEIREP